MEQPSNETLNVLIKNVKADTFEIKEHLIKLNNSVAKNSKFRTQAKIYFSILGFVMSSVLIPIIILYLKKRLLL